MSGPLSEYQRIQQSRADLKKLQDSGDAAAKQWWWSQDPCTKAWHYMLQAIQYNYNYHTMYFIVYHAMCAPRQGITCCRQVWGAGRVGKGVARDARREACTRIPAQVPVTRVGIRDGICTNGCLYGHTAGISLSFCAVLLKVKLPVVFHSYWCLHIGSYAESYVKYAVRHMLVGILLVCHVLGIPCYAQSYASHPGIPAYWQHCPVCPRYVFPLPGFQSWRALVCRGMSTMCWTMSWYVSDTYCV